MPRPTKDEYFLNIMRETGKRSTCPRRQVGAVLVDGGGSILATGYNGVPKGYPHCIEKDCGGATYKSGEGLDKCMAVHAELNAIIQLAGRAYQGPLTLYLPTTPCIHCAKVLCNTDVKRIVAEDVYDHPQALKLLDDVGIGVEIVNKPVIDSRPKVLIVEGIPGAGKTTAIDVIRSKIPSILVNPSREEGKSSFNEKNMNYLDMINSCDDIYDPQKLWIFDRFCWSDIVFSEHFGRDCENIDPVVQYLNKSFDWAVMFFDTDPGIAADCQTHSSYEAHELSKMRQTYFKVLPTSLNRLIPVYNRSILTAINGVTLRWPQFNQK